MFGLLAHAALILTLAFGFALWRSAPLRAEGAEGGHGAARGRQNPWDADAALAVLKAGNERYATGEHVHPKKDQSDRDLLSGGQAPLAAILSCADSRAPTELLFDQGLGDLFTVRAAGATPGVDQLGSLEYAVTHLGVPLIVVLSHTKCGAVGAALSGETEPGALGELLKELDPIAQAVASLPDERKASEAVILTAKIFSEELVQKSPVLAQYVAANKLKIVAAVYDIDSGKVSFLEEN
ncbi:MAG: carbonic anhydrase [Deltaproteobacteria bacterium]|jgi:carbonic anhydrase|nr:carbonic anhydrase [Deltaproteobacteria bacterium]